MAEPEDRFRLAWLTVPVLAPQSCGDIAADYTTRLFRVLHELCITVTIEYDHDLAES